MTRNKLSTVGLPSIPMNFGTNYLNVVPSNVSATWSSAIHSCPFPFFFLCAKIGLIERDAPGSPAFGCFLKWFLTLLNQRFSFPALSEVVFKAEIFIALLLQRYLVNES